MTATDKRRLFMLRYQWLARRLKTAGFTYDDIRRFLKVHHGFDVSVQHLKRLMYEARDKN